MDKTQIQIVEDDSITARYIKKGLETYDYEVFPSVFYAEDAINAASELKPDLFLMDINLAGKMDGIDAAAKINRIFDIPVIYLTAYYDSNTVERAKATGAYGYIIKPVDMKSLNVVIQIALSKHRFEKELNKTRRWLDMILNSIGEAVITTDTQGCIKFINPVAETFTGWKQPEALERTLAEVLHLVNEESGEKIDDITETAIRDKKPMFNLSEHNVLVARNGQKTPVDYSTAPIININGNLEGVVVVFHNSVERIQIESTLQAKNNDLTNFIYSVSHDLKSPLVTIQTFLGYLEQDTRNSDAPRIEKDFEYIRNAADKMSLLLDELLELSRVGHITNPPVEASLQVIVQEALSLVAGRIAQQGVQVKVTEKPIMLYGDRIHLVEVFQNLIDNAVKFMGNQPKPCVEIGVEQTDNKTVLFVRDNGIGIDSRHQSKLFGLFERLNPHIKGTGIGLVLVKRIVKLHGGKIWVESEGPGKGTTFRFTLAKTRQLKT